MAIIAVVGIGVGLATSVGTTAYQADQAKKAQKKADEEVQRQELQAELESTKIKADLQQSDDVAKFEVADTGVGTSLSDLFVSPTEKKKSTTGIAGTDTIQNTLGV